ncbi:MAG TPA: hypothetical protein VMV88_09580 [Gallionella sp.]|nr:hypothetical protein [Gallionella sp.]
MDIVMNIGSQEIVRSLMETEYGDEVMCAGWIPAVAQMCQQQPFVSTNKPTTFPPDLATVNADLFMRRMYAYQR